MNILEIAFWALFGIVFFTYIGYGGVLYFLVSLKRQRSQKNRLVGESYQPTVSLVIATYNEHDCIKEKIENSLNLNYPKDKFEVVFISDGTTDWSYEILMANRDIRHLYQPERRGKTAAINRAMKHINSDIVVFSDANALLNENAIQELVKHFKNPEIGCVAGEKKVISSEQDDAASAGEGMYWKYESTLKKWDAELNSAIGAAGELYAVRRELFTEVPTDTILDDFTISMLIVSKGYKIAYEPNAYAMEHSSLNVEEEMKRKVRISAGGLQAIVRLRHMLNIFKFGTLTFQYVSHRVLRWTITPICLFFLIPVNLMLLEYGVLYQVLLGLQAFFYFGAFMGWRMQKQKIKNKWFFIPYYFFVMNLSVVLGMFRFMKSNQSVVWEKAKRAPSTSQAS